MKRTTSLIALILAICMLLSGCASVISEFSELVGDVTLPEKKRASDDADFPTGDSNGIYDRIAAMFGDDGDEADFSEDTLQILREKLGYETEVSPAAADDDGIDVIKPVKEAVETAESEAQFELVHFDEMPYEAPDVDAFSEAVSDVEALLDRNADAEQIAQYVTLCNEAYYSFYTNHHIAMIRNSMDVTDASAAADYDECQLAAVEMDRLYNDMYDLCAYSDIRDELEALCFEEGELLEYVEEDDNFSDEDYDRYYELLAEEAELLTEYRSINANPTVTVDGVTYNYHEAMNDPSIDWETADAIWDAYYEKYNPALGEIYVELIGVRNQIAKHLGYDSYEEFAFDFQYERDYTPEEANALVADIKTYIAPVYARALEGEAWYWLWDPDVTEDELGAMVDLLSAELGGSIAETWELLNAYGLCDYRIAYEKETSSYQTYLYDYEVPFTFVYSAGYQSDVLSLVHELGHAVDANVNDDATTSLDLAEIYSQALEYLLICRADNEDLKAYKMLDTLDTYAQQGSNHEFERQVYALSESELTVDRINEISLQTAIDFGYYEEGEEDYYLQNWIDIPHFFESPFYVISYCVSNDAAFQIYSLEAAQQGSGLAQYERLLPRDHDDLMETLEAQSDLALPFAEGRMEETASILDAYLDEYLSNLW